MSKEEKQTNADKMAQEIVNNPQDEESINHPLTREYLDGLAKAIHENPAFGMLATLLVRHHTRGNNPHESELLSYILSHLNKLGEEPPTEEASSQHSGNLPADFIDLLKNHFDEKPESKGILKLLQQDNIGELLKKHKDELGEDVSLMDLIRHVANKFAPENTAEEITEEVPNKKVVVEGVNINPKKGRSAIKGAVDFSTMTPEQIRQVTKMYKLK